MFGTVPVAGRGLTDSGFFFNDTATTEIYTLSLHDALPIAGPFAAHLDMLHVRQDPVALAVAMTSDAGSGALAAGLIEQLEKDARGRERRAHEIFTRFCAGAGLAVIGAPNPASAKAPSGEWHVETGEEAQWMATYAVAADL